MFYPGIDHITISVGGGYVVSADQSSWSGCYIHDTVYNGGNLSGYYVGWAFPKNAYAY